MDKRNLFSNNTSKISNEQEPERKPFVKPFQVWILLLTDPSFLELLHHLLIMANCSSLSQKCTSYPVPLFQDVWQLSTQLMFHEKLRKENEEKQWPCIRGVMFLENWVHYGIPHTTHFTRHGTSVILRTGLHPSYKFNCSIVSCSKRFTQ